MDNINKKPSIVDEIIKNRGSEVPLNTSNIIKVQMDLETFFDTQCSKEEFKKLILSCSANELKAIELLFDLMRDNERFEVSPFESLDQNTNTCIWVTKKNKMTTNNFKVRTAGKMWHLIGLYGFGFVEFKTSLAELYEASKG